MKSIQLPEPLRILFDKHFIYPIQERLPEDIYLTGYPKSGNTWLEHMLFGLVYGADMRFVPDKLVKMIFPDVNYSNIYFRINNFTIFKTHNQPDPSIKRAIQIVRDGRDCMASLYAMNKSLKMNPNWHDMIIDGKGLLGYPKWHIYFKKWIENPYNTNILWIKYEDLLLNPLLEANKIVRFLEIERSDDVIRTAVESTCFTEMSRKENTMGWFNQNWDRNERFVRKGVRGSYKREIPPEYVEHFEHEAKEILKHFGYLEQRD